MSSVCHLSLLNPDDHMQRETEHENVALGLTLKSACVVASRPRGAMREQLRVPAVPGRLSEDRSCKLDLITGTLRTSSRSKPNKPTAHSPQVHQNLASLHAFPKSLICEPG